MSAEPNTVHLHRILRAPAERVYRAFTEAPALERWLPPYGFTGTIHNLDVREGGGYRASFTNFETGSVHSFSVEFVELVPNERIRQIDQFDDLNLPGDMAFTIEFRAVPCGTELSMVQEGIPAVLPLDMCYLGWQESLEQLARLVEPEISDNG